MAKLLISVRSAQEASAAFEGGASLIDVKEPSRGSLGRAQDARIAAVIRSIAGRQPVSAAMGELRDGLPGFAGEGLAYVKWGLAGCRGWRSWPGKLALAITELQRAHPSCRAVAVAYADWHRAGAPPPGQVCAFACTHPCGAFLLDTCHKDSTSLLNWLPRSAIEELCQTCRRAGVRVALAGSLDADKILFLRGVEPDWFAVRGAVCQDGRREQAIDPLAVRRLTNLIGA